MSYPLTTPTPSQLAPRNRRIAAAQAAQFIEGNGPGLFGGKASLATALDTIAPSTPGATTVTTNKTHQKTK
jgi:hypothetical protein